jgi:hypothetical protein
MVLYFVLSQRLTGEDVSAAAPEGRAARWPTQSPATWIEVEGTLTETLGKWPIGGLAFGINPAACEQRGRGRQHRG